MYTKGMKMAVAAMAFAMVLSANVFAAESRKVESKQEAEAAVSRDQAQQIAQQQVSGGKVVESEFNRHWLSDNDYEFTVVDDANRYEIRVDAKTGQVKKVKKEAIFNDALSDGEKGRIAAGAVTPERAREIAMSRAPAAHIVEMERFFDMDRDRVVYNVEMLGDKTQVDMKLDGMTGDVLAYEEQHYDSNDRLSRLEARAFADNWPNNAMY